MRLAYEERAALLSWDCASKHQRKISWPSFVCEMSALTGCGGREAHIESSSSPCSLKAEYPDAFPLMGVEAPPRSRDRETWALLKPLRVNDVRSMVAMTGAYRDDPPGDANTLTPEYITTWDQRQAGKTHSAGRTNSGSVPCRNIQCEEDIVRLGPLDCPRSDSNRVDTLIESR